MSLANRHVIESALHAETARRVAAEFRLKVLHSQFDPHTLFNTLSTLSALIASDPAAADTMLMHLVACLRGSTSCQASPSHTLADEFTRINHYLAILQVRMADRLQCELYLPDELADVRLPAMLLQPLVENAITHGLETKIEGGTLSVSAELEEGFVVITVRDTGLGIKPKPRDESTQVPTGLALVAERLASRYGASASCRVVAAEDSAGGTTAIVRFPAMGPAR